MVVPARIPIEPVGAIALQATGLEIPSLEAKLLAVALRAIPDAAAKAKDGLNKIKPIKEEPSRLAEAMLLGSKVWQTLRTAPRSGVDVQGGKTKGWADIWGAPRIAEIQARQALKGTPEEFQQMQGKGALVGAEEVNEGLGQLALEIEKNMGDINKFLTKGFGAIETAGFTPVEKKIRELTKVLHGTGDALDRLDRFGGAKSVQGFIDRLKELRQGQLVAELQKLGDNLERDIMFKGFERDLAKLRERGADPQQITGLRDKFQRREEQREREKGLETLAEKAKAVREAIKTPWQRLKDQQQELLNLWQKGLITQDEMVARFKQHKEDYFGALEASRPDSLSVPALKRGSAAARSMILQTQAESPEVKAIEEGNRLLASIDRGIKDRQKPRISSLAGGAIV